MNMKKIIFPLLAFSIIGLSACSDNSDDGLYEGVDRTKITIPKAVDRTKITIPKTESVDRTKITKPKGSSQ